MTTPAPDARLLRRVRLQLVLWSGLAVLAVLLALGFALYVAVASSLASTGTTQLVRRADPLVQFIRESRIPPERAPLGLIFGGETSGTLALIVGPGNEVLGPPELQLPRGLPDVAGVTAARAGRADVQTARVQDVPIRVLSHPADRRGERYVVQVVQDRTAEERTLNTFLSVLGFGSLLALTASVLAGAGYAGRALVPIRVALKRQREFAADASHELRTPLTVVRGNVELLRRRVPDDPPTLAVLDDLESEVTHLAALVEDLLLLARTDSGAVEITPQSLDLADVAVDAMPTLGGLAEAKEVRLELDAAPTPTIGDALRLRQLVTILVDNAVRHTAPTGRVTIRVRPDGNRSVLEVDDDGPGVRPEDAPHVFDRFWRSPSAPPGGTGLGLAIAAWIVERHAGSIGVERAPGRGARFWVRLPADRGAPAVRGASRRVAAEPPVGEGPTAS